MQNQNSHTASEEMSQENVFYFGPDDDVICTKTHTCVLDLIQLQHIEKIKLLQQLHETQQQLQLLHQTQQQLHLTQQQLHLTQQQLHQTKLQETQHKRQLQKFTKITSFIEQRISKLHPNVVKVREENFYTLLFNYSVCKYIIDCIVETSETFKNTFTTSWNLFFKSNYDQTCTDDEAEPNCSSAPPKYTWNIFPNGNIYTETRPAGWYTAINTIGANQHCGNTQQEKFRIWKQLYDLVDALMNKCPAVNIQECTAALKQHNNNIQKAAEAINANNYTK